MTRMHRHSIARPVAMCASHRSGSSGCNGPGSTHAPHPPASPPMPAVAQAILANAMLSTGSRRPAPCRPGRSVGLAGRSILISARGVARAGRRLNGRGVRAGSAFFLPEARVCSPDGRGGNAAHPDVRRAPVGGQSRWRKRRRRAARTGAASTVISHISSQSGFPYLAPVVLIVDRGRALWSTGAEPSSIC